MNPETPMQACLTISGLPETQEKKPDTTARAGRAAFKGNSRDAQEIVVPFDENSFSGLLVSEKEFATLYSAKRARPQLEELRMETGRDFGRIVTQPSILQMTGGVMVSFLSLSEKLLMAYTTAVLLCAFPLPRWSSMTLAGAWITILLIFCFVRSRLSVSLLVWTVSVLATLAWVYYVPLMSYLFRT